MFAQFGYIKFDLITYFNGLDEVKSYNFAEHARIENKPKLQYTGDSLQEYSIKLNFHASFCTPEIEIKKLKALANLHIPQPFVLGNGEYLGIFLITEMSSQTEQSDKEGNLISIQTQLKLKEFNGKIPKKNKSKTGLSLR